MSPSNLAYRHAGKPAIRATIALLSHFRAFLASEASEMRDPYDSAWRDGARRLDKAAARRKLTWLIHVAINRKAGLPDRPLNHRGAPCRKTAPDYQVHLQRDIVRLQDIRRRIRVYQFESPECRRRFSHRLSSHHD